MLFAPMREETWLVDALPSPPLQRTWSSVALGSTPLNGEVVGQLSKVDGLRCRSGRLLSMMSVRLQYRPVATANLDDFHRLLQDEHVRRYLLDGNLFPRDWSEERMRDSESLFVRRGVGIWLAYDSSSDELVGFCGFLELPESHPEPQLVYAIFEQYGGRGLATEMARASIDEARAKPGFDDVVTGVDEVNTASVRVLEKLGFQRISIHQGSFGSVHLFRLQGRNVPQPALPNQESQAADHLGRSAPSVTPPPVGSSPSRSTRP